MKKKTILLLFYSLKSQTKGTSLNSRHPSRTESYFEYEWHPRQKSHLMKITFDRLPNHLSSTLSSLSESVNFSSTFELAFPQDNHYMKQLAWPRIFQNQKHKGHDTDWGEMQIQVFPCHIHSSGPNALMEYQVSYTF